MRNAIIAVLAYDRDCSLWDAARLLSVGEEGYAFRARVGARVRGLPEFKEISEFFTSELSAQLSDARSTTTAKLDAPVNKLARLLNSASIKRVLLNESLRVDFDRVIAGREVLIVKGALGGMGAGNTSVLMQLLVGMLDAALARQQDLVAAEERVAVCLKVDEAPLVVNRGFAETMALKRSAGLETVACWQTDSQWTEREVREQLDALFAHRVCFATASVDDARASARLMMAQFSDTVRPRIEHLSALGHPDARLHLPKHYAIASWSTPEGRQPPFLAQTIPLRVDRQRIEAHRVRQAQRGGRYREDLSQPHWERQHADAARIPHAATAAAVMSVEGGASAAQARPPQAQVHSPGRLPSAQPQPQSPSSQPSSSPSRPQTGVRPSLPGLPAKAAASFAELVDMDGAQSVRQAPTATPTRPVRLEERDLDVLQSVGSFRHLLSSQVHRRIDPDRTISTTQRRLKRLADGGLIERLQFHRRDGGGVPMCLALTRAGLEAARERELLAWAGGERGQEPAGGAGARTGAAALAAAKRDIRAAAWVLALERALRVRLGILRDPGAAISPPFRRTAEGQVALGPADLRLPGGRAAHDFLRPGAEGAREQLDRFETIRPQLVVEQPGRRGLRGRDGAGDRTDAAENGEAAVRRPLPGSDLMLELDDRCASQAWQAKICRYDHFLTGWWAHTRRYGRPGARPPLVIVICRDRSRARECARRADRLLIACRAYAGEYPSDWEYAGRRQIVFVSERDIHEGVVAGYGVSRLPPQVRAGTGEDPRTSQPAYEISAIADAPDQAGSALPSDSRAG